MIIKNGLVYGEDFSFKKADIQITGESFGEIAPQLPADEKEQIIDAEGLYVIPGLVDIHFHGCAGYDFCDGTVEAFDAIMQYEMEHGVTSVSPATMTLSEGSLRRSLRMPENMRITAEARYAVSRWRDRLFRWQRRARRTPAIFIARICGSLRRCRSFPVV